MIVKSKKGVRRFRVVDFANNVCVCEGGGGGGREQG